MRLSRLPALCLRRVAASASEPWSAGAALCHTRSAETSGRQEAEAASLRNAAGSQRRRLEHVRRRNKDLSSKQSEWRDDEAQQLEGQDASDSMMDHRQMQLVFLGTSASTPTITRNTSCIALRLYGTIFLFDCGEGVQRQLQRTPFRQTTIDNVFITHMHGDHQGLLCSLGMLSPPTKKPVNIFGPVGLREWIRTTLKTCQARMFPKYVVHELVLKEGRSFKRAATRNLAGDRHEDELPGEDILSSKDGLWHVHKDDRYTVKAGLLAHTIPCWGYVVEERSRPGRFSVERAVKAGVRPGPMFSQLQNGHAVTLGNGKVVKPSDVLGETRRGRKVVILGDTCDSRSLINAARRADVLVHEATLTEQDAAEAKTRGHSTATMAGEFAKAVDADKLVLTHFSGKLEGALHGVSERGAGTVQDLVLAAKCAFGKEVLAARDLFALTVHATDEPANTGAFVAMDNSIPPLVAAA